MSSIVELNVGAKRFHVKPTVVAAAQQPLPPAGGIKLEVGKKYITNAGYVIGPMQMPTKAAHKAYNYLCVPREQIVGDEGYGDVVRYYSSTNGAYVGSGLADPRSIKAEYIEMDPVEKAWMDGAVIEYCSYGHWTPAYAYATIAGAFGATSPTTKEWWAKNYAPYTPRLKEQA